MAELIEDGFEGKSESDSIVAFQYTDLQQTAKAILAKATKTANAKIEQAKKNISELEEKIRQQGYDKGFAQGLEQGEVEGRKNGEAAARAEFETKVGGLNGALQNILGELNYRKQTIQAQAEVDLLALSLEIAKKIVRREVEIDERFVVPVVMEAIALTNNKSDLVIKVNPADHKVIEEEIPTLEAIFNDIGRVSIIDDDTIQQGGVKVSNREGEVDLRLDEQISALEKALVGDTKGMEEWNGQINTPLPSSEELAPLPEVAQVTEIADNISGETPELSTEQIPQNQEVAPVRKKGSRNVKKTRSSNDEKIKNTDMSKPAAAPQSSTPETSDTAVAENTVNPALQSSLSGVASLSDFALGNEEEAIIKEIIESNVGAKDA